MSNEEPGGFKPIVQFDLLKGTPLQFAEITEEFEKYRKTLPAPSPLNLSNGWYTVNSPLAQEYLCRNIKGANREVALSNVRYDARQMRRGDWVKTGEPLCFTVDGKLVNGQHRLWACYLSGASFETYIVFDVPVNEFVFAYYDNGKTRTAATALRTGGFDGVSPLINSVISIRENVNHGAYSMNRAVVRQDRLAPIEVLRIAQSDPKLKEAARLIAGEYQAAIHVIGHKDVAAYAAYRILSSYDEVVLEEFMRDVEAPEGELPEGNAAGALCRCLEADRRKLKPMPKHLVLAHVIKAFNAWRANEPVKRLKIPVTDEFPAFAEGESTTESTEATE
jgi:hypothetical protein